MKLYKLLKDLPTVKAGAIFKEKIKIDGTRVLKACESDRKHSILVREIDNFDEWFEPTNSISWKLKWGDRYWTMVMFITPKKSVKKLMNVNWLKSDCEKRQRLSQTLKMAKAAM